MGALSRRVLDRLIVGSTAEAVLDKLACDVLIVKPAGAMARDAQRAGAPSETVTLL
jgi:hypothetical protein